MFKNLIFVFALTGVFAHTVLGDGFYSVHSPNGVDVWAVGNGGVVFHSFDGGANWTTFTRGSTPLRSVHTNGSTVWIVGDGGALHRSTNGGSSWSMQTLAGGVTLRAVTFADPQTGWIAGDGGTILKTTDGGASWVSQTSNTSQHLYAVAFINTQTGYAAGAAATLVKTTNGGSTWTSIAPGGWTKDILSVSASGSTVYVSGVDEFCYKSTNSGATWTELDFKTDTHSDVNAVYATSSTTAFFVGGGGFIRKTTNGGTTFTFGIHQMHAKLNGVFFYDASKGWVCSEKNNAVLRTTDGGTTWQLPQGTTVNYQWSQRQTGTSIGNTFCVNPWDKNVIYVVLGSTIYRSPDRGETWVSTGRSVAGGGSVWSFYVSPKDTMKWLAASSGGSKGVRRSTNAGQTWTTTLLRNFTTYGMPLEMDPDNPDTVIFAEEKPTTSDAVLYISTNFGATWDTLAQTTFRSPCDVVIVPGNTRLWYVGDGVTGSGNAQMWRSDDYGRTWTSIYSVSGSEIPMISTSRLQNTMAFATAWGSGGFWKTTNSGMTWSQIATTGSTWGTDVAKDDPNVVLYGTYGGSTSYLSTNAGASFNAVPLTGSNSAMLAYDRATFLAHQASNGVWKYNITYTVPVTNAQVITLISPAGGESWAYNTVHTITWSAGNIDTVRLEYKTAPGNPWQVIAPKVLASLGTYAWTIPNTPTNQARVRVSDAADGTPVDSNLTYFSITVASISVTPSALAFGSVGIGQLRSDTVRISNSGNGTLVISSAVTGTSSFAPGRTSFTIAPGQSDTLSVVFSPGAVQNFTDTLTIVSNAVDSPTKIPLSGDGIQLFDFLAKVHVRDNVGYADSLEFGTAPGATDGIDPSLGEKELPPLPPLGAFDVRWQIVGTQGSKRDVRETLGGERTKVVYVAMVQVADGGYPFRVRWNPAQLPDGLLILRGSGFAVDMHAVDSLVVTDSKVTTFIVEYHDAATVSRSVTQGWGMLSLPVRVFDRRKTAVFPTAVSDAFTFMSGYVRHDTLEYRRGYWIKFGSAETLEIDGGRVARDSIDVVPGWNMIGSISTAVAVGSIVQVPPGIVASAYYEFVGGSYQVASTIEPMKGYWVKVHQSGKLVLVESAVTTPSGLIKGTIK